jgi:shikimate kinase
MNITLIGMTGVGKSSIGKVLAKNLDYSFLDVDALIEKIAGKSLQQIIDAKGEDLFLQIEEQAVLGLKLEADCVVATGGSVVYSKEAMNFLKSKSKVIYLKASYENINKWVSNRFSRGVVGIGNKNLKEIFDERLELYGRYADYTITLDENYGAERIADELTKHVFGW